MNELLKNLKSMRENLTNEKNDYLCSKEWNVEVYDKYEKKIKSINNMIIEIENKGFIDKDKVDEVVKDCDVK